MATTGEFITKLASMAGLDTSSSDFVSILSNSEFSNYKIPDELIGKINSSLFTMESARNNETLRKHYHGEILNGLDANMENMMEQYGFDTDIADSIRQEKRTMDKYRRLVEKLNDVHARKSQSTSKSDKAELENEISRLNGQIKDLNTKIQTAPQERDAYWTDKLKSKAIQNMLSSYSYAAEKDIPKDVLIETASILLNKKLNEQKVRLDYSADQDSISLKTESGMDFYKDNSPVSFKAFADQVLAENKLLSIPGANNAPTPSAAQPAPMNQTIISGGKQSDASRFFAALDDIAAGR